MAFGKPWPLSLNIDGDQHGVEPTTSFSVYIFLPFLPPRREGHIFTVYTPNNINGICHFSFITSFLGAADLDGSRLLTTRDVVPGAHTPITWELGSLASPCVSGNPRPPVGLYSHFVRVSLATHPAAADGLIARSIWEIPRGMRRTVFARS